MCQENNFIVLNIREYLQEDAVRLGEEKLKYLLSEFSCPLNPEVEHFLKDQAIEFAKKHQAVTYIVLSLEDAQLLGYFAITIKSLVIKAESFSNTTKRKPARFSEFNQKEQTYNLAAYLIAQLGRNLSENVKGRITGKELLEAAIQQALLLQYHVGGMVLFVETNNEEKLISFYEDYGFKRFDTRQIETEKEPRELVQLLRLMK